ncbi:hypothetical protein [Planktothrix phage Pra-JY27]|nr:peptidase S74 domain-containing protein [Planktothrix phage Pag-Yong1]WEV89210.1 hypothetical protein [Synechococcus phage MinM2]
MSGTTQNVVQSNLPLYAEPYYKQMMEWAGSIANPNQPYPTYPGQRLADLSPEQMAGINRTGALPASYEGGIRMGNEAAGALTEFGRDVMGGSLYDPRDYENEMFSSEQIAGAMDPYTELVLDRAGARARERFDEQQVMRDAAAARTGSFGGSRRYVTDAMAARDLNNQLSDLEATTLSNAFREARGFLGEQRQLGEASRQFGAGTALRGADVIGMGGNLGLNAATQGQRAELSTIDALLKAGALRQGQEQRGMDIGYQDFINQRDWPLQNLATYSSILRGLPVTPNQTSTQTRTQNDPGVWNQIGGGLLAASALFR